MYEVHFHSHNLTRLVFLERCEHTVPEPKTYYAHNDLCARTRSYADQSVTINFKYPPSPLIIELDSDDMQWVGAIYKQRHSNKDPNMFLTTSMQTFNYQSTCFIFTTALILLKLYLYMRWYVATFPASWMNHHTMQ